MPGLPDVNDLYLLRADTDRPPELPILGSLVESPSTGIHRRTSDCSRGRR